MIPQAFYVFRRIEERPGTITLHIKAAESGIGAFAPGQFNMLYAFGHGEAPISLSGSVLDSSVYVHTLKALGSVTRALADLHEGDALGVRGPFGKSWPTELLEGRSLMIISGGLGLAPLRPLLYGLRAGHYKARHVELFHGVKHPDQMLFGDELADWSGSVTCHVSSDEADKNWNGHVGTVVSLVAQLGQVSSDTLCFICGPEVMIRYAIAELRKKNLPAEHIYVSVERHMQCGTGHCGHCQWGPHFVCRDGPVFCYRDIQDWFGIKEL